MRRTWWVVAVGVAAVSLASSPAVASSTGIGRTLSAISTVEDAIEKYRATHGDYPRNDELGGWYEKLIAAKLINKDYPRSDDAAVGRVPLDGWGRPLVYLTPDRSPTGLMRLGSLGTDGIDNGGEADDFFADRGANDGYYWYRDRPTMRRWLAVFGVVLVAWIVQLVRKPEKWLGTAKWLPAYAALVVVLCAPMLHERARSSYWNGGLYWIYVASMLVLAVWIGVWLCSFMYDDQRRFLRKRSGQCHGCGYSLVGLPKTVIHCPECGTVRAAEDAAAG